LAKLLNSGTGPGQNHHNCPGHNYQPVNRGTLAVRVARLEESELYVVDRVHRCENAFGKVAQQLKDLETRFIDQIKELTEMLSRRFADRDQNNAEHEDLARQIKNLYDLLMQFINAEKPVEGQDDAMLSKKPLQ
jgi:hypothetical protein